MRGPLDPPVAGKDRVSYRALQAQETRRRIAAAARRRFAAGGYAGTTMAAIAAEAGVAVSTVYAAFKTKAAVLAAVRESWLEAAGVRPLLLGAPAEPDAAARLGGVARAFRSRWEHGADVRAILEGAADDPAAATVLRGGRDEERRAMAEVVAGLAGSLAYGVSAPDALALLTALTAFEVYATLVERWGWSAGRYEEWLAGLLRRELLAAR
jgi:AcrR family transcriptional regulator